MAAIVFLMSRGQFMLAGLLAAALFAIRLLELNEKLIYWVLFFSASSIVAPVSALKTVPVSLFLQMLFVGKMILDWVLLPQKRQRLRFPDYMLIGVVLLLMATAVVRGAGFYSLGSSGLGGAEYIERILGILFMLLASLLVRTQNFSPKLCFLFILYGTLLKTILYFSAKVFPGLSGLISRFTDLPVGGWVSEEGASLRLPVLGGLAVAIIPFVMRRPKFTERVLLGGMCLVLSMMSGFRSGMVGIALLLVVAEIYMYRLTAIKCLIGAILGSSSLLAAWLLMPHLGFRVQRALVAIPGFVNRASDAQAIFDASASLEWRQDLYRVCLERLPDYFLIGRGFGDSVEDVVSMLAYFSIGTPTAEVFFMTHAYHLAIFDLFIDYGGIVTLLLLLVLICSVIKNKRKKEMMGEFEKYSVAYLIVALISFVTVWSNFHGRFLYISMAYIIISSFLFRPQQQEKNGARREGIR